MKQLLFSFFVLLLLSSCTQTVPSVQDVLIEQPLVPLVSQQLNNSFFDEELDQFITTQVAQSPFPSLGIAVLKDNHIFTQSYGLQDKEENIAATTQTRYLIASVSKTVTTTAVLQLYEQGKIDLDANVNHYLGFSLKNPHYPDAPITARMLLTHTSSLRDSWEGAFDELYTLESGGGDSKVPLASFVQDYFLEQGAYYDEEYNFEQELPGEVYRYQNINFALLGYMVERVSGLSFDEYTKRYIFDVAGMPNTTWFLKKTDLTYLAIPYSEDGKRLVHYGHPSYPDGFLKTTSADFARFLQASFNGTLLEQKTLDEMLTVQVAQDGDKQGLGWGLCGVTDACNEQQRVASHTGGDSGATSFVLMYPDEGLGFVFFANQENEEDLFEEAYIAPIVEEVIKRARR